MRTYCIAQGILLKTPKEMNPKEIQKEGIYVYVWLVHFAVQYKLTQYCQAIILQ